MHGTFYNRYVVPYLLGETAFLSLFSLKHQEKFLNFLHKHHLLGTGNIITIESGVVEAEGEGVWVVRELVENQTHSSDL